jgi:hypothetical protein
LQELTRNQTETRIVNRISRNSSGDEEENQKPVNSDKKKALLATVHRQNQAYGR